MLLEWVLAARSSRLAYIPNEEFLAILEECEITTQNEINKNEIVSFPETAEKRDSTLCKKSLKKKKQVHNYSNIEVSIIATFLTCFFSDPASVKSVQEEHI